MRVINGRTVSYGETLELATFLVKPAALVRLMERLASTSRANVVYTHATSEMIAEYAKQGGIGRTAFIEDEVLFYIAAAHELLTPARYNIYINDAVPLKDWYTHANPYSRSLQSSLAESTPLAVAVRLDLPRVVSALLRSGAGWSKCIMGYSVLTWAALLNRVACARALYNAATPQQWAAMCAP